MVGGMSFFLSDPYDFARHNEDVKRVWEAHAARKPYRVPVSVAGSITNYMLNPVLNTRGWSFEDYFENPNVQIKAQLEYQKWQRYHLVCDREMGPPESAWDVGVDFQNCYDAGWFGCPLNYFDGQLPDTEPILKDDKMRLYDMPRELPHNNGLLARGMAFFDEMGELCRGMEFEGKPVNPPGGYIGEGTDGPFELALKVRGAENVMIDMFEDEKYYRDLMSYITENLIRRIKKYRELRWAMFPESPDAGKHKKPYGFADDAVAMISVETYREFVLPYHKRFVEEFSDGTDIGIHLCGDATHLFKCLNEELGVNGFDTGFPVDHGLLRRELGPDVAINGGPTVMILKYGTPGEVEAEVKRICQSGVMQVGKFVMIAANNMAPCTPIENVRALYEATKVWGRYS
jgi:hypothetical protein